MRAVIIFSKSVVLGFTLFSLVLSSSVRADEENREQPTPPPALSESPRIEDNTTLSDGARCAMAIVGIGVTATVLYFMWPALKPAPVIVAPAPESVLVKLQKNAEENREKGEKLSSELGEKEGREKREVLFKGARHFSEYLTAICVEKQIAPEFQAEILKTATKVTSSYKLDIEKLLPENVKAADRLAGAIIYKAVGESAVFAKAVSASENATKSRALIVSGWVGELFGSDEADDVRLRAYQLRQAGREEKWDVVKIKFNLMTNDLYLGHLLRVEKKRAASGN